jgi:AcrR family transcriptional regulator
MRRSSEKTKSKIISAAWKLFYEKGFERASVEDIVSLSGTSKGTFYHYFEGKDSLIGTLSTLFDEKYEELLPTLPEQASAIDKLLYLNRELFMMIENSISIELLARLLATQLFAKGERQLLDRDRTYYKLLFKIVREGQRKGELNPRHSANDIVKAYALTERAFMYDWCLCSGEYSLSDYASPLLSAFLSHFSEGFSVDEK